MSHQLETIIGYKFKHPELLETALTHTSYANESRAPVKHNERLEFLGDSVLQIVSADYLFHAYADRPEGDSLGVGTVGGMLVGTVALLFVVPVLFTVFQAIEERVMPRRQTDAAE